MGFRPEGKIYFKVFGMNLPPPTWLRSFEAAARLGSFTAAASELGLTPAAISQHMRLLEEHLKTPLFERQARGIALTERGKAYALPVRQGFADLHSATQGLFATTQRQRIRVRASISCAALVLAPRLHGFLTQHPNIDVDLSTFVWADGFEGGESDLDIRFGYGDWRDGEVTLLAHESAIPVCNPAYLESLGPSPTVETLSKGHIFTIHGAESDWPDLFAQTGLMGPTPARITRCDSSLMALQAVATGPGVALVFESFALSYRQQGVLLAPVPDKIAIRPAHFLVKRAGRSGSEPVRAFADWVTQLYQSLASE